MNRAQGEHCGVDRMDILHAPLRQHLKQPVSDSSADQRIIAGTVVVEIIKLELFRHDVQPESAQLRHQALGDSQSVHIGHVPRNPLLLAGTADEISIKIRIMGHQYAVTDELPEFW